MSLRRINRAQRLFIEVALRLGGAKSLSVEAVGISQADRPRVVLQQPLNLNTRRRSAQGVHNVSK
jgi:hypothetical protein